MNCRRLLLSICLLIGIITPSAAYVGTAPGLQDLGTLEKGQTYESRFYILTDRSNPFLIEPKYAEAQSSVLEGGERNNYDFDPSEASEENIKDWISFSQESYNVDPDDVRVIDLQNGGVARASQKVTYDISVPEDAESGYHIGAVNLNPDFSSSGAGTASVQTVGLTQFTFLFKVPGEAERDLKVLDVNAKRASTGKVRLDFLIQNNGSVTTEIQSAETTVYDKVGNKTGLINIGGGKISPGETKIVKTFWEKEAIDPGQYRVEGKMDYITGQTYIDQAVRIPERIQIKSGDSGTGDDSGVPLWLVAILLAAMAAVMYYFEINPVYIASVLGLGGLSAGVLITGLPNSLLAVVLLVPASYLIYRWI